MPHFRPHDGPGGWAREQMRRQLWRHDGLGVHLLTDDEVLRLMGIGAEGGHRSAGGALADEEPITRKVWRLPIATVDAEPEPAPAPRRRSAPAPAPEPASPAEDFVGVDAVAQAAVLEQAAEAGAPLCAK